MPGHSVSASEREKVSKDVTLLEDLIKDEHDVVFLLTDSRESRWLPTLMCARFNKMCINAALGFDSYLVMRHGPSPSSFELNSGKTEKSEKSEKSEKNENAGRLGCYFCNDVTAPQDSLKERTLDQQCTVTRPGTSFIASSLAVELMVSLLHHPLCLLAPAETNEGKDGADVFFAKTSSVLGKVPHQIRGFLSHFVNVLVFASAYDKCTACSSLVIDEYMKSGFDFLEKTFNDPKYLENLTGLTQMHQEVSNIDFEWDDSDEIEDF